MPHTPIRSLATPPPIRRVLVAVAFASVYALAVYLTSKLRLAGLGVVLVWPAGGILLAAMLIAPLRRWPELLVAAYLAFAMFVAPGLHYTPVTGAIFHFGMVLQLAFAIVLVRVVLRAVPCLSDPKALMLLALGLVVAAVPGGVLRTALIRWWDGQPFAAFDFARNIAFAMAVILGTFNSVPLILSLLDREWRVRQWSRSTTMETLLLVFVVVGMEFLPPIYLPVVQSHLPMTMILPIVPFLWASMRVGLPGVSACLTVYMIVASWRASIGAGAFGGTLAEANAITLQLWMITLSMPTLAVAAVLDDRACALRALEQSQARTHDLAGRLISAQEAERSRIGRDLHDNIGQLLSSLSIGLSRLKQRARQRADVSDDAGALQRRAVALTEEVRRLSHGLHSGVLQHAGIVEALRALCDEARALGYDVRFEAAAERHPLSDDVQLCFFRVAQEALRNAMKHSGMKRANLDLTWEANWVTLTVADDGCGFAADSDDTTTGVGLASMRERLRLAGGRLLIRSEPGGGTLLRATVPVAS